MKNQHTPGPWEVSPYNNITSKNGTIAKTEQMPGNDEAERKANAHLIAAAPDLLSALRLMLTREMPQDGSLDWKIENGRRIQALAAIAKAEGEK